jgi:Flp pilus assembly protein TadG
MGASTGNSSPGRTSGVFEPSSELTLGLFMLLLALGAGIVALGELFRFSLGMPGHHGLEAMALLATARLATNYRWAATIAAAA